MSQLPSPPFKRIPLKSLFDVSEIITVLLYDFSPNFQTPGESHDFWEMVYVDRGELTITAGKKKHKLKQGDLVFHEPGEFHNVECDGIHSATVFIMTFDCRSDAMSHFAEKIVRIPTELTKLMRLLISECGSGFTVSQYPLELRPDAPTGVEQLIKIYLEELLIRLVRYNFDSTTGEISAQRYTAEDTLVRDMCSYMARHVYTNVTIEQLCEEFHFGKSHLCEIFKRATGVSIFRYYLTLKLTEAKRMLHEDSMSVGEISERLGFESQSYFARLFKRHIGVTPREFRAALVSDGTVRLK